LSPPALVAQLTHFANEAAHVRTEPAAQAISSLQPTERGRLVLADVHRAPRLQIMLENLGVKPAVFGHYDVDRGALGVIVSHSVLNRRVMLPGSPPIFYTCIESMW
jgi:hypothetical protein